MVFVLDKHKKPLMPCSEKRARLLLERGRARIHKMMPFTIRLVDRLQENSVLQPVRLKIDPGSKSTGMALVREEDTEETDGKRKLYVLMLIELQHRGKAIRKTLTQRRAFRRARRYRKARYRPTRFDNRTRRNGWLAPSLQHRVDTTMAWVKRLIKLAPVAAISQELVKFDTQAMQNPEISGIEYQQGTLAGYELREYLLEKWKRKCAYCGVENVPLEIDHIHPKSRGGSNRVSNLTLACHKCNQAKNNKPIEEFLADNPQKLQKILKQAKAPLDDASAVNTTRWALWSSLKNTGLPLETASGGRTKYNRIKLNIPKDHCLDAVCIGNTGKVTNWRQPILCIKATGRGSYKRTRLDKNGFPRGYLMHTKGIFGFQTGDMVKAVVAKGKKIGTYIGRAAVRASGNFNIQTASGLIEGINYVYCKLIQRSDGYGYAWAKKDYSMAKEAVNG